MWGMTSHLGLQGHRWYQESGMHKEQEKCSLRHLRGNKLNDRHIFQYIFVRNRQAVPVARNSQYFLMPTWVFIWIPALWGLRQKQHPRWRTAQCCSNLTRTGRQRFKGDVLLLWLELSSHLFSASSHQSSKFWLTNPSGPHSVSASSALVRISIWICILPFISTAQNKNMWQQKPEDNRFTTRAMSTALAASALPV